MGCFRQGMGGDEGDEREPVSAVKGNQVRVEIKREIMEST